MRVTVHDPIGPWWSRAIVPFLGGILALAGAGAASTSVLSAGLAMVFLGPLFVPRHGVRRAELDIGPGVVRLRRAGALGQRIAGRQLAGATTARLDGRPWAILQSSRPVGVGFESEVDLEKALFALGIGRHGFGKIVWRTEPARTDRLARTVRIAAGLAAVAMLALDVLWGFPLGSAYSSAEFVSAPAPAPPVLYAVGSILAIFGPYLGIAALAFTLTAYHQRGLGSSVRLLSAGILVQRGVERAWRRDAIPYADVSGARLVDGGIEILRRDGAESVHVATSAPKFGLLLGMADDERSMVVAQIEAAAARAHGEAAPEPCLASTSPRCGARSASPHARGSNGSTPSRRR